MKTIYRNRTLQKTLVVVSLLLSMCFLSACLLRTQKKWWNYSDNWQTTDNRIFLYDIPDDSYGRLFRIIEQDYSVTYDVVTTNDGTIIKVYPLGATYGNSVVMTAESKVEDGHLYLTFTFDQPHGLEGKTIVLEKMDENDIPQ